MDYIVLVAPFLFVALIFISLVLLLKKFYKTGVILFILSNIFNVYTESVPFNLNFDDEKGDLKVLSYNIFSSSDYFKSVEKNPKEMTEFLLTQDADVIILHEYFIYSCGALKDSLLKVYPYYEQQEEFDCSIAIFSKYEMTPLEDLYLDLENNEWVVNKMNQAEAYDHLRSMNPHRAVSSTTLKIGNDSVRLIAAHLASNHFDKSREEMSGTDLRKREKTKNFLKCLKAGRIEREVEIQSIMKEVKDLNAKGQKVIIAGDMNDVSGSSTLKNMQRDGILKNAWWEKGFGMGLTFHSHKVMHFRIDHMLYTDNIKLKNISVLSQNFSDHNALVSNFDL